MKTMTTLLEAVGAVLIVAGVSLVYVPAAFVVAGVGAITLSWRLTGAGD